MAQRSKGATLSYWQRQVERTVGPIAPMAGGEEPYKPECVMVEKVYDECTVSECPTVTFTNLVGTPTGVVDCRVISSEVVDTNIPNDGTVEFTIRWKMEVIYTTDNQTRTTTEHFALTKRVRLPGARMGMSVRTFHIVQCLNCRPVTVNDNVIIECEVGIFAVVKATFMVQLEVERARFCPQPPECIQVSPIGCPEWADLVESGQLWPPFPPQIDHRR